MSTQQYVMVKIWNEEEYKKFIKYLIKLYKKITETKKQEFN